MTKIDGTKIDGDAFLRRWSSRKSEARRSRKEALLETAASERRPADISAPADPSPDLSPSSTSDGEDGAIAAKGAGDTPASPDCPDRQQPGTEPNFEDFDFESLGKDSDYGAFMQDGVPDWAQQRALNKLWQSDEIFANLDGLNDYDEDFTAAAIGGQIVRTAYRVGKGFLTDEELAGKELATDADADEALAGEEELAGETVSGAQTLGEEVDGERVGGERVGGESVGGESVGGEAIAAPESAAEINGAQEPDTQDGAAAGEKEFTDAPGRGGAAERDGPPVSADARPGTLQDDASTVDNPESHAADKSSSDTKLTTGTE